MVPFRIVTLLKQAWTRLCQMALLSPDLVSSISVDFSSHCRASSGSHVCSMTCVLTSAHCKPAQLLGVRGIVQVAMLTYILLQAANLDSSSSSSSSSTVPVQQATAWLPKPHGDLPW